MELSSLTPLSCRLKDQTCSARNRIRPASGGQILLAQFEVGEPRRPIDEAVCVASNVVNLFDAFRRSLADEEAKPASKVAAKTEGREGQEEQSQGRGSAGNAPANRRQAARGGEKAGSGKEACFSASQGWLIPLASLNPASGRARGAADRHAQPALESSPAPRRSQTFPRRPARAAERDSSNLRRDVAHARRLVLALLQRPRLQSFCAGGNCATFRHSLGPVPV